MVNRWPGRIIERDADAVPVHDLRDRHLEQLGDRESVSPARTV